MRLQLAETIAHAAIDHAEKIGARVCVAVCDDDGRIISFLKMDGTDVMSGHEAMRRAVTAAGAHSPSEVVGDWRNTSASVAAEGIGLSTRAGGLPLMSAQQSFGGIGVCGGTSEQAVECASVGAAAVFVGQGS